jgi:starch phosphorylase
MEKHKLSFTEAREAAAAGNVYTTHTPVSAGHDYFEPELMKKYFTKMTDRLSLPFNDFMALGRESQNDEKELFCMTILAMKLSNRRNGVSRLHGEVSRAMWQRLWPGVPEDEIPIKHVTNGVHASSWISKEMANLFDRYLGPRWREQPGDQSIWKGIDAIPAGELWNIHKTRRERMIAFARRKLGAQLRNRGASQAEEVAAEEVLDPDILTIGFARRFATYKRATLLLKDRDRLRRLLTDSERPLQLVFSGKAHPKDEPGKKLIREIIHFAREEDIRNRIVFLENYNMDVGRYLYQGVDVWLNTPVRPREASGTSGMKAAFNGAINLSILDGWWDEAYAPDLGWAIGHGEDYEDSELQDAVESNSLYDILEKDVIPTFYERSRDGVPRKWVARMKDSMTNLCPVFNTNRMVQEYTGKFYMPARDQAVRVFEDDLRLTRDIAAWKSKIHSHWSQIQVLKIEAKTDSHLQVGDILEVEATIKLSHLKPDDVSVQLYFGRLDVKGNITMARNVEMQNSGNKDNKYLFTSGTVSLAHSGRYGYTVRVIPRHQEVNNAFDTGLIVWAS